MAGRMAHGMVVGLCILIFGTGAVEAAGGLNPCSRNAPTISARFLGVAGSSTTSC